MLFRAHRLLFGPAWVVAALWLAPAPLGAQTSGSVPVAIVEEVDSAGSGLGVFDYLQEGDTIHLKTGEVLILGYLTSCLRESIHGGRVTIGATQSEVAGGLVIREKVECDGGYTNLSAAEASQSGVIVFRQVPKHGHGSRSNPIQVFSLQPVFLFPAEVSQVMLRRLDRSESDLRVPVEGRWLDLGHSRLSLAAGGLYEARAGGVSRVFELAESSDGGGPLVSRLVRF